MLAAAFGVIDAPHAQALTGMPRLADMRRPMFVAGLDAFFRRLKLRLGLLDLLRQLFVPGRDFLLQPLSGRVGFAAQFAIELFLLRRAIPHRPFQLVEQFDRFAYGESAIHSLLWLGSKSFRFG